MKRLYFVLSVLVALSMLLSACGTPAAPATEAPAATTAPSVATEAPAAAAPAATEAPAAPKELEGTLNVWSFTNDTRIASVAFMEKNPKVKINFTMIPMTNGEYQTKVKAAAGTADAPDLVALEAGFVREWVEAPKLLADLTDLVPLTKDIKYYQSVIDAASFQGVTKGFDYEATPGAFFYRRSIAQECLGTDDPAKVQEMVADMTKYMETAAKIKACGTSNYYMSSTNADLETPFLFNRVDPWVKDGKLVIDPKVVEYIHFAKQMRDNGYETGAGQWSEGWFAAMNDTLKDANGKSMKVFGYFLPTWGLPYVLQNNAKSKDGSSDTSGDWAMASGPLPYQWGGTWFGVINGSKNADLAKEFIKYCNLSLEFQTKWASGYFTNAKLKEIDPTVPADLQKQAGDYVSSQIVNEKLAADPTAASKFLGGQNPYVGFLAAASHISAKLMTGSDDAIGRALNDPRDAYLSGKMTEAQMWQAFLDNVSAEFPDLVLPEPPVK